MDRSQSQRRAKRCTCQVVQGNAKKLRHWSTVWVFESKLKPKKWCVHEALRNNWLLVSSSEKRVMLKLLHYKIESQLMLSATLQYLCLVIAEIRRNNRNNNELIYIMTMQAHTESDKLSSFWSVTNCPYSLGLLSNNSLFQHIIGWRSRWGI